MPTVPQSDPRLPVGKNYCKCSACGHYFGGVFAFDLHRVGNANARKCVNPQSLASKYGEPVLFLNERGYWVRAYSKPACAKPAAA